MKTTSITAILILGLSHSVFAQLYTTTFTGGFDPAVFTEVNTFGPSIVLKNPDSSDGDDFLNYHTAGVTPAGFESVFLVYEGSAPATPTNAQDFTVLMSVTNFGNTLTSATGSQAELGFALNSTDLSSGFAFVNGAYSFSEGVGSSDAIFRFGAGALDFYQPETFEFNASMTLAIEFIASSQTFFVSRALPGDTFDLIASLKIDGLGSSTFRNEVQDWGMNVGDSFDINIFAGSNVAIVNADPGFGFMNADNFSLNVVPEPSAYAAILGLVALAGVLARRRRG